MIRWTDKRLKSLQDEIERARKRRKAVQDHYGWDDNLERYVPLPRTDATGAKTWDVNVGADFQDVERKKAALFYDTPAVALVPDEPSAPVTPPPPPPQPGQPPPPPPVTMGSLVSLHQRLLNGMLGHRGADAKAKVLKVLFDVLCPAGIGAVKVGYDVASMPVEQPVMDPMTGQPVLNPLGVPQTQTVPVPIHEDWYLARISPYAYLVPADHRDTDVTQAPWVAYDFCLPVSEARRRFGLPEDWKPRNVGGEDDKPYYKDEDLAVPGGDGEPEVTGVYLEYHPAQMAEPGDPVAHPLQIAELVLIDGEEKPVVDRPSPYQQIGEDARLTPDSITHFTIVPLTLRDRTDQPYVPSDCTVTGPLTKELNKYRTVIVQQRDGNRQVMLYDPEKINPDARQKIANGDVGAWVPVEPGMLDSGVAMQQVAQLSSSREAWTGQDYIERDRERILGIGGNQVGVSQKGGAKTATEVSTAQRNSEARFEQERQRVLMWYLRVVGLFDALILRFADARTAARYLGPQAAQMWAQHKGVLAGGYRYEIQMDSGKYVDIEANKRQLLQLLNMVGQSQHVNVVPLLKRLATTFGFDPSELVVDQPPKKGPEPPKVSLTFKGDDFNAGLPQFDIIVELAKQGGYQISDKAVAAAKLKAAEQALTGTMYPAEAGTPVNPAAGTEPPQIQKTLPRMPTLNSHQAEESGGMPGPGPM